MCPFPFALNLRTHWLHPLTAGGKLVKIPRTVELLNLKVTKHFTGHLLKDAPETGDRQSLRNV